MDFANMFQTSITDAINNTLGPGVMDSLKNLLKQPLKDYAEKPSEFHRDLSRIFGSAALTLEKMITKELFKRVDLHYSSELDFETSVNQAARDYMSSKRGND